MIIYNVYNNERKYMRKLNSYKDYNNKKNNTM